MSTSDRQTEGQLSERPLAELIRELIDAGLSGALRLSNGPARVVIYFEKGELLFATSNLRAHRLREVFKRNAIAEGQIDDFPSQMSDEELGAALLQKGSITTDVLQKMRSTQAADVLRQAILWTAGEWSYERRVRIAADLRVPIDITRLLLESARRLPLAFIKSRVGVGATKYSIKKLNDLPLSPTESLALSRVAAATDEVSLADLAATKGLSERNSLRSVYALCVAGVLYPGEYQTVLSGPPKITVAPREVKEAAPPVAPIAPDAAVNALFSRLNA
ncbi:MAG TPA: DUF4388 domain-containing protein, partial [Pyrinomonadaceae bacterium]|nr:DUF4388 domain-containing protein [Pyrinomonadaceae bacterium]